jgi:hypothetical protein
MKYFFYLAFIYDIYLKLKPDSLEAVAKGYPRIGVQEIN